jgi:hypothetical protein
MNIIFIGLPPALVVTLISILRTIIILLLILYLDNVYTVEGPLLRLSKMNEPMLHMLALEGIFIGKIQTLQDTFHSNGMDLIIWPVLLIIAWWIILARTFTILKILAIPAIAISTYFVLLIIYKTISI